MEIQYRRSYAPARGKRYTAGEIPAMLGYALEIADPRVEMREGKLAPGELCVLLFGITPEEYAWRESAPKKLDALAEQLRKAVPADRLIGWRVCDLKGSPAQRTVQPRTGESIDDGAFARALRARSGADEAGPLDAPLMECARLQRVCAAPDAAEAAQAELRSARRVLGAALRKVERLYVADEALLNGRWPCVSLDGRVELFTLKSRAERGQRRAAEASGGANLWQIREIPAAEIEDSLRRWAADGLTALRLDNGFAAAQLQISDVLEAEPAENAALRALLMRELSCGARWNRLKEADAPEPVQRGMLESALTLRNFAWRALGQARLWVLCAGADNRNIALVGRPDSRERLLAAFTERTRAAAFGKRLPGAPRPVEYAFDELARRAEGAGGMVVDAQELGYRLDAEAFEKVRALRDKPPLAVRIAPPKPAQGAGSRPVAGEGELPNPDEVTPPAQGAGSRPAAGVGDLPNPDEVTPPAQGAEHQPGEAAVEAPEKREKRGLFSRLFGK